MTPQFRDEFQFWLQIRRGLLTIAAALARPQTTDKEFRTQVRRGILTMSSAIERRFGLQKNHAAETTQE